MTSRRGPVLLGLALLCGLGAAAVAYLGLRTLAHRTAAGRSAEWREVVVTTTDLSYGVRLDRSVLRVVRVPREAVPNGAFASIDSVQGQITKVFLSAREPVTAAKLSSRGGGLSMMVRPNMRAASVEVNQVSGVSGFVLPGDRVDVLSTVEAHAGEHDAVTRTLLQAVEVLAAGQKTQPGENKPMTVQSVTLLVDPRGAEMLAHAQHEGELTLVLRNPDDPTAAEVASFSTREMLGLSSAPPPTPTRVRAVARTTTRARVQATPASTPPPVSVPAPPGRIRIIRSADVSETPAVVDSIRH